MTFRNELIFGLAANMADIKEIVSYILYKAEVDL